MAGYSAERFRKPDLTCCTSMLGFIRRLIYRNGAKGPAVLHRADRGVFGNDYFNLVIQILIFPTLNRGGLTLSLGVRVCFGVSSHS